MAQKATHQAQGPAPAMARCDEPDLHDMRFRALLGKAAWDGLPPGVRTRFAKHLGPGQSASYVGQVEACSMSRTGWLLAQLCRLIGAPLPLDRGSGAAAVVTVTEDAASGGQVWTRMYTRRGGFPQVIHSAKRFAGPTGLEEYLGGGFGIALTVSADGSGIRFASDHYFWMLGGLRLRLPRWLCPGALQIDHQDCGGGCFLFTLRLTHALLGELMQQRSRFHDQQFRFEGDTE